MTRQVVRERLVVLFASKGFNQVYGHAPLDLQGFDKVLAIYSDRTRHDFISANLQNAFYALTLDVYVKRESGETAEDNLDILHEVVRDVIRDNIGDPNWSDIHLLEDSDAYFAEVSGVPYRVERHTAIVKETES
jgi:hypothetical protein